MPSYDSVGDSTVHSRSQATGPGSETRVPALTIVWHPDVTRVGSRAVLADVLDGVERSVTRLQPLFGQPGDVETDPLADSRLSRSQEAFTLAYQPGRGLEIRPGAARVDVHGVQLDRPMPIAPTELDQGVIITLAGRIVLCLHRARLPSTRGPGHGLVGGSDVLEQVREEIRRVADLGIPVLIRGESGTGKELVARAIVAASRRRDKPLVAVNLAAVPATTALAELFGHEKGAFTGAGAARVGYFGEAAGGTIFLDEIGLAPMDLQQSLLRVLEAGEYYPVGASRSRKSDAQIIAATDVDLEQSMASRAFFLPLYQRLAGFELILPPLRRRREDFGTLLVHCLRAELAVVGEPHRLTPDSPDAPSWLSARDVARLAMGSWPGNVRALRNAARQIAIASRGRPQATIGLSVERLAEPSAMPETPPPQPALAEAVAAPPAIPTAQPEASASAIPPWELSRDVLLEALERNGYDYAPTAASLGIPRTTLNRLMDRHQISRASSLSDDELVAEYNAAGGDLNQLAARLKMSRRALRLRLGALKKAGSK
jgi:two-component system nitrogen regulation response regulator GlnG